MGVDVSKQNFWVLSTPPEGSVVIDKTNFWALSGPPEGSVVVEKTTYWVLVIPAPVTSRRRMSLM